MLPTEHGFVVPFQKLNVGQIEACGREHGERMAMMLVVVTTVLVLHLDARAHFNIQVGRHRDVAPVEQNVQVRSQNSPLSTLFGPFP